MTVNQPVKSEYRLYYRPSDGTPLYYSMEDLDGDYIVVDHLTFEVGRYDIVVKNGRIHSLSEMGISKYYQVNESTDTTVRCDPSDIAIIVDSDSEHILWDYRSRD